MESDYNPYASLYKILSLAKESGTFKVPLEDNADKDYEFKEFLDSLLKTFISSEISSELKKVYTLEPEPEPAEPEPAETWPEHNYAKGVYKKIYLNEFKKKSTDYKDILDLFKEDSQQPSKASPLKYIGTDSGNNVIFDEIPADVYLKENFLTENNKMNPTCKYLTFDNESISILSKEYSYANVPKNIGICSNPSVAVDLTPKYCQYVMEQHNCDIYNYDTEVLKVDSVSYGPYLPETKIALSYVENINILEMKFEHYFEITDIENKSLIQKIRYDQTEYDYDLALNSALEIYNEYLKEYDSYQNLQNESFDISHVDDQKKISPNNYFEHILDLVK